VAYNPAAKITATITRHNVILGTRVLVITQLLLACDSPCSCESQLVLKPRRAAIH
jgi:hypothetical protein